MLILFFWGVLKAASRLLRFFSRVRDLIMGGCSYFFSGRFVKIEDDDLVSTDRGHFQEILHRPTGISIVLFVILRS